MNLAPITPLGGEVEGQESGSRDGSALVAGGFVLDATEQLALRVWSACMPCIGLCAWGRAGLWSGVDVALDAAEGAVEEKIVPRSL